MKTTTVYRTYIVTHDLEVEDQIVIDLQSDDQEKRFKAQAYIQNEIKNLLIDEYELLDTTIVMEDENHEEIELYGVWGT